MGLRWATIDNDGYEDLYVTAYGGNKLYHNNGNGTFTRRDGTGRGGRQRMVDQRGMGGS